MRRSWCPRETRPSGCFGASRLGFCDDQRLRPTHHRHPLAIDHPLGGTRLIAALWPHGDGLVLADIGWPENDGAHPFNAVAGPLRYDGFAWHCAPVDGEPVLIRPLFAWEGDLAAAWVRWRRWLAVHPEYGGDAARRAWAGAALGSSSGSGT